MKIFSKATYLPQSFCMLVMGFVLCLAVRADPPADGTAGAAWIGDYVYGNPDANPDHFFVVLKITRGDGGKFLVQVGAGHNGKGSPGPVGGGDGVLDKDGVIYFDFEDSYHNKGVGVLRRTETGDCQLSINVKEVKKPGCLVYYQPHVLKRT